MTDVLWSSKNMCWGTPQWLYDLLDNEFNFVLDAAADYGTNKCEMFFTPKDDAIKKSWDVGGSVYCNPPYGRQLQRFVKKAWEESTKTNYPIVLLIPARTDTRWFHDYIIGKAEIRFIKGRLRFLNEEGEEAKENAPFPSMIVIYNGKKVTE